jgi:hypothetical protein
VSACRGADLPFVQSGTGLSSGNLSSHLTKPEAAGLLSIEKDFVGRMPCTRVQLTEVDRKTIDRHWQTSSACATARGVDTRSRRSLVARREVVLTSARH